LEYLMVFGPLELGRRIGCAVSLLGPHVYLMHVYLNLF
jgi:hypothetical protein